MTRLIYTGNISDDTPTLFAVDKARGETLARIEAPAESSLGMMASVSYTHLTLPTSDLV